MRESKNKKSENCCSDGNSTSLQMELELIAVKAKNADLIKAHTKLVQENSEMKNQIYSLQAELLNVEAKYNNLESILKNVEQNMKKCTPNLIDVLNLFLQVTDSRKNSFNMLDMSDRVSDRGFTPKAKTITHTVKPHTVNGTVLNLVPTISLTRLNTTNTSQQLNEVSSGSYNLDYRNSLPSTSRSDSYGQNNENISPNVDNSESENQSFVSRRRNTNSTNKVSLTGSLDMAEDDTEIEEQPSDESDVEEENIQRLSTIQEESIRSSGRKRTSLGEVRIYLSRLSTEDLHSRRSQNSSFGSTDANVNDTCLNIETTVIENPENRVSKRLRADIMVFSPHTNSTRMEGDETIFNDLSPRDNRRTRYTKSAVSGIQSTEVTPGTSMAISAIQGTEVTPRTSMENGNDELVTSNQVTWLPTPSMSALGDIDASNTSKLEILKDLGVSPSSPNWSNNKNDSPSKNSLLLQPTTPQRYTRSKVNTRSRSKTDDDESPTSSIENRTANRLDKSVNLLRGASGGRPLTPTIVLERLENRRTTSSVNIEIIAQSDDPKENEDPPNKLNTKTKKSKSRAKSKTPKRSVKRKIKDVEEPETILHEKIRDIQIRLSNYIPETSENSLESPKDNTKRPSRAARPKNLKDSSLKGKLRRMF